jgi:hypothetical protein
MNLIFGGVNPLTRLTSWKILTLVITICMLGAGIAPAKSSCTADCCATPQNHAPHTMVKAASAGLLPDCCSDSETAPCPHLLESASEIKFYAVSACSAEVDPTMAKLPVGSTDWSLARPAYHRVSASMRVPVRGPSVPLFLQNLSLLI